MKTMTTSKNNSLDNFKKCQMCKFAREFLKGTQAAVVDDGRVRANITGGSKTEVVEIKTVDQHYKVLAAYNNGKYNGYSAVFNMNKINGENCVELKSPSEKVARKVIGKGGENVKNWAKLLGVKKILVTFPVEVEAAERAANVEKTNVTVETTVAETPASTAKKTKGTKKAKVAENTETVAE